MKVTATRIPDVKLLTPVLHEDARGYLYESFSEAAFAIATGRQVRFVQDNQVRSQRNVIRGLHYQAEPHAQGKLVRVTSGAIYDVAVDLRPDSPTFGQWAGHVLSAGNRTQIWIPEGFAHGYLTLTDSSECLYKLTAHYTPGTEKTIAWNDPDLAIEWPLTSDPILSQKDRSAAAFAQAFSIASQA